MAIHIHYLQGLPIGLAEMRDADYAYFTTVLTVAGEIASSGLTQLKHRGSVARHHRRITNQWQTRSRRQGHPR